MDWLHSSRKLPPDWHLGHSSRTCGGEEIWLVSRRVPPQYRYCQLHQLVARVIDAASQAFDRGYLTVMYVVAAVLTVGAVITAVLLRNYGPGSQSSIYSSH